MIDTPEPTYVVLRVRYALFVGGGGLSESSKSIINAFRDDDTSELSVKYFSHCRIRSVASYSLRQLSAEIDVLNIFFFPYVL